MALFLDRVDSAPMLSDEFSFEFGSWVSLLVDTLNEDINDIQGAISSTSAVTGTTQDVEINSNYTPTNAALTTFQLPDMAAVGSNVSIAGAGAGGWILLTGAGQTIELPEVPASATVSVASSGQYDSISIRCVVADTTWVVMSMSTTGFVIV